MNILKAILISVIVLILSGCIGNSTTNILSNKTIIQTDEFITPKIINTPIPDERVIDITYSHKVNEYVGMRKSRSSSGMIYLFVTMIIENHGYQSFSVNPYNWKIEINNIQYNHHWVTYELNNRFDTQTIMNDGQFSGNIAFEIPKNGLDVNNYTYSIIYDENFNDYNINYHKT